MIELIIYMAKTNLISPDFYESITF